MKTGRKGENARQAGSTPMCGGWESAVEVFPEKRGVRVPHQAPRLGVPVPGRGAHKASSCENQQGFHPSVWVSQKAAGKPGIKGPVTELLTCRHLPWALAEGKRLRKLQRHIGRNWVVGFRARSGGTTASSLCWALFLLSWQASPIFPVFSPPPARPNLNLH